MAINKTMHTNFRTLQNVISRLIWWQSLPSSLNPVSSNLDISTSYKKRAKRISRYQRINKFSHHNLNIVQYVFHHKNFLRMYFNFHFCHMYLLTPSIQTPSYNTFSHKHIIFFQQVFYYKNFCLNPFSFLFLEQVFFQHSVSKYSWIAKVRH